MMHRYQGLMSDEFFKDLSTEEIDDIKDYFGQ